MTRSELLVRYQAWKAERERISELDGTSHVDYGDWEQSDDDAVELLGDVMDFFFS